ncbi:MAG TPA: right-handed parallel beta-helix repeat-containing protein, partial [Spirochaetia bacterium]|nr:right-handed parallel beta-helix repeat-containing protein [Spirochaetia bacterium]
SRACLPKKGHYWMKSVPGLDLSKGMVDQFIPGNDRFYADPSEVGPWRNPTDIDVVGDHYWVEERLPVESIDSKTGLVRCRRRSVFVLRDDLGGKLCRYRFENVAEALTEPGEWYLDRTSGSLTYLALPGEEPGKTLVTAPCTTELLALRGTEANPVRGVTVENLTFECTDWQQPPAGSLEGFEDAGLLRADEAYGAATQAACNLGGVISGEYAQDCTLRDLTIRNTGHYAVVLGRGCRRVTVAGNRMEDLGAGGVRLNGGNAYAEKSAHNGEHQITDNEILHGGRVFLSAVGVLLMHSYGNLVAHNHIQDFYYTGVSCGWVWGYDASVSRDNRIEYNHIHDIGQGVLSDMGGIYTLGVQPGTVLRGNRIHDVQQRNYGGWCIYLDEGSSHILVEGNVCYRAGTQVFNQHYGRENVVRNNLFAFGGHTVVSTGRLEDHNSFTLTNNILVTDGKPVIAIAAARGEGRLGFRADSNLVWDTKGAPCFCAILATEKPGDARRWTEAAWKETRNDLFSIVADPRFADPAKDDFTLKPDSPAARIGFTAFDLSRAGPRKGTTGA